MLKLPIALAALGKYKQFILCKNKLPINPKTGALHDAHDPTLHLTHTEALTYWLRHRFCFYEIRSLFFPRYR